MSLINDALKRANEQKAKQVTAQELGATLQTVESNSADIKLWPIAVVVSLLACSAWLGWSWWRGAGATVAGTEAPVEVAARTTTPPLPSAASPLNIDPDTPPPVIQAPPPYVPPAPVVAAPPPPLPTPATVPVSAGATRSPASSVATRPAAVSSSTPGVAATAPPPPAPHAEPAVFPRLVLQGIYYKPSRPSAVINSKTVYIGDRVSQAKILAIDRREVTVQWGSEVRVLAIE
jgi:hypothetical protein